MLVFFFGYKYFNILYRLRSTQRFHGTSQLISYICLCSWHSVKGKNPTWYSVKRSLRKPVSHLNKSQMTKVLMQVLLWVHGSKSIHSYVEVIMSFVCFSEGKTKLS